MKQLLRLMAKGANRREARLLPGWAIPVILLVAGPVSPGAGAAEAEAGAGGPRGSARGGRTISLDELLAALDRNHDGRISRGEATGTYGPRFAQWDADGDGFATPREIHDYRLRLGIDDRGFRIANGGRGGSSPGPAASGQTGNNPRGRGGARGARAAATATFLEGPADWRLETMPVPPGFAPDIACRGAEEIRFAPGMFDPGASDYFTCILALLLEDAPDLGSEAIKDFLEKYYRGLSIGVGRRKGLAPDPQQMVAGLESAPPGAGATSRFVGHIVFFDTFSDGRRITLNVEALVVPRPEQRQTGLVLLVSPSAGTAAVWPTLRDLGRQAALRMRGPD